MRLTLAAAFVLLLAAPSAAHAINRPGEYYGLNVQTLFRMPIVPPERWGSYLDQMAAGGMLRARADAYWAAIEPNAPVGGVHKYHWSGPVPGRSMDTQARLLASRNIRMVAVVALPPPWAGGLALRRAHYGDFAKFGAAFAARYGPDGTFWAENPDLPALPVREYELWTEANSTNFWTGRGDQPQEYVDALRLMTPAIKQVDPSAKVLASIGWEGGDSYVRQMYALGARGLIDGIAFHPYAPHVQAMVDLVKAMRTTLRGLGEPNMPMFLTETGQPVTYTGPGALRADSGLVTDAARAATQTITGDALARSDCNVQDFQVFSIVGTEAPGQSDYEGFMGVMRPNAPEPNVTGAALLRASARWRAQESGGIVLCGSGTTPLGAMLPLTLTLRHVTPTCVRGVTMYDGDPLEWADMMLTTTDGRFTQFKTDSSGRMELCIPDGPPIWRFKVYSVVPSLAISPTYECRVPATTTVPEGTCVPTKTEEAAASGQPPQPRNRACGWRATLGRPEVARGKVSVATGFECRTRARAARVDVGIRSKDGRVRKGKMVTLRAGATSTFALGQPLQGEDQVELTVRPDGRRGLPALNARALTVGGDVGDSGDGCDWKLEARVYRSRKGSSKVRARLTCPPDALRSGRFTLGLQRAGKGKTRVVRRLTLRSGRQRVVVVRNARRGDRVVLRGAADPAATLPALRATVRVTKGSRSIVSLRP